MQQLVRNEELLPSVMKLVRSEAVFWGWEELIDLKIFYLRTFLKELTLLNMLIICILVKMRSEILVKTVPAISCVMSKRLLYYSGPLSYDRPELWTVMTGILWPVLSHDLNAGHLCFQMVSDTELIFREFWKEQDNILSCVGFIEKSWVSVCKDGDVEGCAEEPEPQLTTWVTATLGMHWVPKSRVHCVSLDSHRRLSLV